MLKLKKIYKHMDSLVTMWWILLD